MTTIKAPFNFVPLNEKVFYPDWAEQVSHDIPFKDCLSGKIEFEMEALSPVFVRNGVESSKMKNENEEYLRFSFFDNQYFIPATSVKGMVRNVLEIFSFSKMPVDKRKKYAQRDWNNKELYTLTTPEVQAKIHCGWLQQVGNDYKITDCGIPYRINQKEIDSYFKIKGIEPFFEKNFCETSSLDLKKIQTIGNQKLDPKTARFKYELLGSKNLNKLREVTFDIDEDTANDYMPRRSKFVPNGSMKGTIVLTGQPNRWKKERKNVKGAGKFYEFIFRDSSKTIAISELEVEQFKFIYKDSEDWKFWNKKLSNGDQIPVFFRTDKKGDKLEIKDLGFALLYKLPYEKSVKDVVEKYQETNHGKMDLPETIFGHTFNQKSLKGRVQFGHAFSKQNTAKVLPKEKFVLGSPKASYYPLYIKQNSTNNRVDKLETYNDGIISGWKRYPVKQTILEGKSMGGKMDTEFLPLDTGAKFNSEIRFHNLKKVELGALLSALSFHGHNENVCHSIGMAKPFGYGKMKLSTCKIVGEGVGNEEECMALFEKEMNSFLGRSWIQSEQIEEIFSMGFVEHGVSNELLSYMKLEMKGPNEFEVAKTSKEFFKPFSMLAFNKPEKESLYEKHKESIDAVQIAIEEAIKEEAKKAAAEAEHKRIQEVKMKEQEEERLKQEKINLLQNIGPDFIKEFDDFNKIKGRLDGWLKQTGNNESLPEEYHEWLRESLTRCYKTLKNFDKKNWAKPFDKNPIFRKVAGWVGKDIAINWQMEIIK